MKRMFKSFFCESPILHAWEDTESAPPKDALRKSRLDIAIYSIKSYSQNYIELSKKK
jgi:hypothetical protein